jgi:hypothetical protein
MRNHTWELLNRHNVAYCIVDEPLLPPEVHLTADFAYFRWHGRGTRPWYDYRYSEEELEEWVPRVEKTRNKVDKIYGYFNNHYHGYAVENCIEILEMLNAAKPEQSRIKERIIQRSARKKPLVHERKLVEFGFGVSEPSIEDLILQLTDRRRLERGREIDAEEIAIEEPSGKTIRAEIRDYVIELDLERRTLKHDCDDWRKGLGMKRLCKHVVALFLSIAEEESKRIPRDIVERKEDWSFQMLQSLVEP